jgi:hypothetical protein
MRCWQEYKESDLDQQGLTLHLKGKETCSNSASESSCSIFSFTTMVLTALRNRLPAPRQDQLTRQAKRQKTKATEAPLSEDVAAAVEPTRVHEIAASAPAWYRSAARRRLYFLLFPACVVSYATSGYDGSMMNSLQTVSYWDDFFGQPRGAQLGLMSAIMSLGSVCSTPIAP